MRVPCFLFRFCSMTSAIGAISSLCSRSGGTTIWNTLNRDRKSTRLNSSHLGISYAVFCLKKQEMKMRADDMPHQLASLLVAAASAHGLGLPRHDGYLWPYMPLRQ